MIKNGLSKVRPDKRDYSLLHTFGALVDPEGLPEHFSIYDGRPIPNQNDIDTRFTPAVRSLPYGCVGETITFEAGIKNNKLYPPDDFYFAIPPGLDGQGRDIREGLKTAITRGIKDTQGNFDKESAYFNVYGAGAISDYDAVKVALWINQGEKRGVIVGTWFYREFVFANSTGNGMALVPSFNTNEASLHCWLITGWKTINGIEYLEGLTWQGQHVEYFSKEIYNALLAQPYTGAFTISKLGSATPVPIGLTAIVDHLVYFVRNLFHV
jgi:hypothetical protein